MARRRIDNPVAVGLVAAVLAGLVTALFLSIVLEDREQATDEPTPLTLAGEGTVPPEIDLIGQSAPDFDYVQLATGDETGLDEFRDGRPMVINFFANWCTPCVREMPELETTYQELGDQVGFLGLSYNEPADEARDLVERTGVTYEIGRDLQGVAGAALAIPYLPTTVFITADGTIARSHTGPLTSEEIEAIIEEDLLA